MFWKLNFITVWIFEFHYRVWVEDREWKYFVDAEILDDQEWHIALEMPTSRTAHVERGRESTPVK
jgi:hypothetical protein